MASTDREKKTLFRGVLGVECRLGEFWSEYATTTHFHVGEEHFLDRKKKVLQFVQNNYYPTNTSAPQSHKNNKDCT